MKAIEMNQALMEAIKTTEVLGASALEETRALRIGERTDRGVGG